MFWAQAHFQVLGFLFQILYNNRRRVFFHFSFPSLMNRILLLVNSKAMLLADPQIEGKADTSEISGIDKGEEKALQVMHHTLWRNTYWQLLQCYLEKTWDWQIYHNFFQRNSLKVGALVRSNWCPSIRPLIVRYRLLSVELTQGFSWM